MASKNAANQNDCSTPMMPLRRYGYSRESLGRYSERSLHSTYLGRYGGGKCIKKKVQRSSFSILCICSFLLLCLQGAIAKTV
jgi:hypothetical protein